MDIDATVTTDINATTGRGQQHSEAKKVELMRSNSCFYCEIKGYQAKDCHKKQADCRNFSSCPDRPRELAKIYATPITTDLQDPDSFASYI